MLGYIFAVALLSKSTGGLVDLLKVPDLKTCLGVAGKFTHEHPTMDGMCFRLNLKHKYSTVCRKYEDCEDVDAKLEEFPPRDTPPSYN